MRPVLPNHFIVELRSPTGWMAQVDRRLASLERDFGDLKQDVKSMKQYVGRLKGMSKEITFRQKASSYLSALLKGSQDASKWAVPFVGGEEWVSQELKQSAL